MKRVTFNAFLVAAAMMASFVVGGCQKPDPPEAMSTSSESVDMHPHLILVEFPIATDLPSEADMKFGKALEDELKTVFAGSAATEADGWEAGNKSYTVWLYTSDVDGALKQLAPTVKQAGLPAGSFVRVVRDSLSDNAQEETIALDKLP
jgi:hypothetical protein